MKNPSIIFRWGKVLVLGILLFFIGGYYLSRNSKEISPKAVIQEENPQKDFSVGIESEDEIVTAQAAPEPVKEEEPQVVKTSQVAKIVVAEKKDAEKKNVEKIETFKLNIPYFHQEYKNSCEAASLRMALSYYGVYKNDMDIVKAFGYDPKLKDVQNNIWDDPQKMFVGFVDLASSTGGYGTYGRPVLRAAENFGRTGLYKNNITPKELAEEIRAGHPVVMWGYTSLTEKPYTWNTAEGNVVKAFHGEHARLVVGVYGKTEDPTGFYVHDPLVGSYKYWSSVSLMAQFNSVPGVTNQVVVVK